MQPSELKRPKRLWVVSIMNIAVATISIVALVFMITSDRVPAEVQPTAVGAAVSGFLGILLIASSLLALLKYLKARWLALGAALIFYGTLLLQSALLVAGAELPDGTSTKLWSSIVRSTIEISLNIWVFLGSKIALYRRAAESAT
jgi:hypothetical protein